MWRIVESKQSLSKRRKELLNSEAKHTDIVSLRAPTFSNKTVLALARNLSCASRVLRELSFVRRDVLLPLQEYLRKHAARTTSVNLLALGIGPFLHEDSRLGFLQMALFLAMKMECEATMRKLGKHIKTDVVKDSTKPALGAEVSASNREGEAIFLTTSFFDPMTGELHTRCCEKLGVKVEKENRYGAYTPADSHALLIAYLPHSPWALLHNLFISNIAVFRGYGGAGQLEGLRGTLIIGNDIREQLSLTNDFMETLIPYLCFQEVRVGNNRCDRCRDNHTDNADDCFFSLPKGVTRNDVFAAFSGIAVMQLNTEREEEFLKVLQRVKIPQAVFGGLDLL